LARYRNIQVVEEEEDEAEKASPLEEEAKTA
jgi:hypothetical protein